MGDRFYEQQKNYKPKRILKKDIVADLTELLGVEIPNADRLTIAALNTLIEAIERKLTE